MIIEKAYRGVAQRVVHMQYTHEVLQRSGTGTWPYGNGEDENFPMKAYRGVAQGVAHMTIRPGRLTEERHRE